MDFLDITHDASIAIITLNRPEKRNALSPTLVSELKLALDDAQSNHNTKVVILRAAGKVFSAGADLAYLQQLQENTYEENLADSQHLRSLFEMIYTFPKPIVAEVQGDAIAGGCGLACVCDFVFAAENARFGYTEVGIGFVPALVSVFLLRKIGEGHVRRLLLSGDLFTATEAQSMGLITEVFAPEDLPDASLRFAHRLAAKNSSQAMALTKKLLLEVQDLSLSQALEVAAKINATARGTEDCKKGIQAFLSKEKVKW